MPGVVKMGYNVPLPGTVLHPAKDLPNLPRVGSSGGVSEHDGGCALIQVPVSELDDFFQGHLPHDGIRSRFR